MIEPYVDGKPVTKLQAARALASLPGELVSVGDPDWQGDRDVIVWPRGRTYGQIQPPLIDCKSFSYRPAAEMRQQAEAIMLAAEVAELAMMIVAEQDAAEAKPELCHYCDIEPATVTMTNGKFCEACAPAVQLATGAAVEPASGLVGTIVEDAADDSPVPVTGKVVRQIDKDTVEVLWGDWQLAEASEKGIPEPIDALRPAREQAGA